jgi:hypothetical protein
MIFNYSIVVREAVWSKPEWINNTFGTTAYLIQNGLNDYIMLIQAISLLLCYIISFKFINNQYHAFLGMAMVLSIFSFTCLWPVTYIFFDIIIFLICFIIVQHTRSLNPFLSNSLGLFCAAVFVVLSTFSIFAISTEAYYNINVGNADSRRFLVKGFSWDERQSDGTSYSWVDGNAAEISIPRRSSRSCEIVVKCRPFLPSLSSRQSMRLKLNNANIGEYILLPGWQEIRVPVLEQRWRLGNNFLRMDFSYAISPNQAGISVDRRRLSVAFDYLEIRRLNS